MIHYPEAWVQIRAFFETFGPTPGTGSAPVIFNARPRSFTITRTPRHLPDKFSVEFDYENFPVDPDLVRGASVDLWVYDKLALSNTVSIPPPPTQLGALRSALAGAKSFGPAIYGLVTEAEAELSEGSRVVRIEGEDYTGLFAKHKWHLRPGQLTKTTKKKVKGRSAKTGRETTKTVSQKIYRKVNLNQPVLAIFQSFIDDLDHFGVLSLRNDVDDVNSSTVIKGLTKMQAKGCLAHQEDTYWDVMNKVARLAGLSVYVDGNEVVLAVAQTLYAQSGVRPYVMRYGGPAANIKDLNLKRDFGKHVSPTIEVHAYDPDKQQTIIEKYPTNVQQVITGGWGWKRDEVQVIPVSGTTDKATLQALARNKFERNARGEREVRITTADMVDAPGIESSDFSLPPDPLDLTQVKAGESFYVLYDPLGLELSTMSAGERTSVLAALGYDAQASQALSDSFGKKSSFNFPFYVKEAKLTWAAEHGLEIEITGMDYSVPGGIRA